MQLLFNPIKPPVERSAAAKAHNPSRVRDHLVNERTYLAWMRSAIALMGFGVLIVRLRSFRPPLSTVPGAGWKLGLVFALMGLITVFLSAQHYFRVRHDIDADTYEPADRLILFFTAIITLLGMGVIYYLFTVPLNPLSGVVFE